ncbi:MAG: hypothetical protein ABSG13_01610 [Bryobacteraceae bacterium]
MKTQGNGRGLRQAVEGMKAVHRIATGMELSAEDAIRYFRDPNAFSRLVESSNALNDPIRRKAIERLIQKGATNGV